MNQHLLLVTEDGYGKRISSTDIRRTNRGTQGVRVSRRPVAIAIVVEADGSEATDTDSDLLISTTSGKVQRISIADVPIKCRTYSTNGPRGIPTGARITRLRDGDRVASGMLSNSSGATGPSNSPVTDATAMGPHIRAEMGVALHEGESIGEICVLHPLGTNPLGELDEIRSFGQQAESRNDWTETEVHARSTYWCSHCGRQHTDPHAVYACLDRRVDQHTGTLTAGR
jgi:hypothetical protein